jgi:hypothetical protein
LQTQRNKLIKKLNWKKMENKTKQIAKQGKMSPPEIESWMTYSWETKQQTPNRLEDAAKYLAVMMTVSMTFFLSVFGKTEQFLEAGWFIKSIPLLWCVSLIFSFLVLYPKRYPFNTSSAESIQEMTEKVIHWKQFMFLISSLCFILGIILFAWMIVFFQK